jgi:hypothetical protein
MTLQAKQAASLELSVAAALPLPAADGGHITSDLKRTNDSFPNYVRVRTCSISPFCGFCEVAHRRTCVLINSALNEVDMFVYLRAK